MVLLGGDFVTQYVYVSVLERERERERDREIERETDLRLAENHPRWLRRRRQWW